MTPETTSCLVDLLCPECFRHFPAGELQGFCQACKSPLVAQYDLAAARDALSKESLVHRRRGLWRWAELLPVQAERFRLTLGEGDTPLLRLDRLGRQLGLEELYVKDESLNPTASFKARGLAVAVARAVELGVRAFVIPTAGNAGGALAAYAARAGAEAHVFMPVDAPRVNQLEVQAAGGDLHLVDGLIQDAARQAARSAAGQDWFDISTFKEPYRLEGKKTMGFELAEGFNWQPPDVIVYPTGGGTGLVGMWKAFAELEAMGWIGSDRPRMVSVQAEGCAPVVRAFHSGAKRIEPWQDAHTLAAGLRVPVVFADRLILSTLHESRGTAVAVSDEEILRCQEELARAEGIWAAPEGAATLAAFHRLQSTGWIRSGERVVLFNTGSGLKYIS